MCTAGFILANRGAYCSSVGFGSTVTNLKIFHHWPENTEFKTYSDYQILGFSVAVMVSTGLWWEEMAPFMFGFGFGTLFFVTQIFGLQMWREISPWWRLLPGILWFIFAIVTVTAIPEVKNSFLSGLVTIPAGQWGCAFAAWLIIYAFSWLKFDKYVSKKMIKIFKLPSDCQNLTQKSLANYFSS